jgi:hypothetical protein
MLTNLNSNEPRGVDLPAPVGDDEAKIFAGPTTLAQREEWRAKLVAWRLDAAQRINYDDQAYRNEAIAGRPNYNAALIWLWDELLFDFENQIFTPEKLLADADRFGGFDDIILWHAYPVIGIDSRNQFDFYNQVPGLAKLISDLQSHGVKVHLNYNPWDKWTTRAPNSDQVEIANIVEKYGFDGVFLDTMKSADPTFMAPILAVKPDVIVGGEARVQQERICDHVMSWAQWFGDSEIPGVMRAKWFERRHMLHQTRRWNRSHREEMQVAWLNGAGMLIWEVVFGSWVGWDEQQVTMWREMVTVLREHHELVTSGDWQPLTKLADSAEFAGLYASKFSNDGNALYTIVNKSDHDYHGEIAFGLVDTVPAHGIAAIWQTPAESVLLEFSYIKKSAEFPSHQNLRKVELTGEVQDFNFSYRNRECSLYSQTHFIDSWKPLPPNYHQIFSDRISVPAALGALDKLEVSNSQYFEFIKATGYQPKVANRFLAHWVDGAPTAEQLEEPVTYVDLTDAQAYATWRGARIPTEWEWQLNSAGIERKKPHCWNLTNSEQSDGRTRFLILKGGSNYNVRNGQGAKSTSGIAESDWYVDGGARDESWVEKLLLMGLGMSRSENISFRCIS